jgi:hypothetical protein
MNRTDKSVLTLSNRKRKWVELCDNNGTLVIVKMSGWRSVVFCNMRQGCLFFQLASHYEYEQTFYLISVAQISGN